MNRRDAFKAIGVALVGTAAEGAEIQSSLANSRPTYIVVKISDDVDPNGLAEVEIQRFKKAAQEICKKAGWGDNFPVFVAGPGVNIEVGCEMSIVIPPNTIVEQLDGYTAIYPVGQRPTT